MDHGASELGMDGTKSLDDIYKTKAKSRTKSTVYSTEVGDEPYCSKDNGCVDSNIRM